MADRDSKLTAERLRELLHYDPKTGIFARRTSISSRSRAGDKVGFSHGNGYLKTLIDGVSFRMHRLAWLYMKGEWPKDQIDHRNTVRSDNRWDNLRELTGRENTHNQRKPHKNNSTGFLGVKRSRRGHRFTAAIGLNGVRRHIGSFATAEKAHAAYVITKRKLHSSSTL